MMMLILKFGVKLVKYIFCWRAKVESPHSLDLGPLSQLGLCLHGPVGPEEGAYLRAISGVISLFFYSLIFLPPPSPFF